VVEGGCCSAFFCVQCTGMLVSWSLYIVPPADCRDWFGGGGGLVLVVVLVVVLVLMAGWYFELIVEER